MGPRTKESSADEETLKSSYPGIWKVPNGFQKPFRNGYDWMESKRADDNIGESCWRVHDKLYNLEEFIEKHPGGSEWLRLTRGTDITEAFESSHVVNVDRVETMLAKYFVADAQQPRLSPYTFKENGFYKTLKRKIQPILKEHGTNSRWQWVLYQDVMVGLFATLAIWGTLSSSFWLKTLGGMVLGWALIGAHNFFHMRRNWRSFYFDLSLLSSHEWMITHSLSHHLYPNTLLDIELELFPTYQFLPNQPKWWLQKYGPPIYSHILYFFGFWIDFARRVCNLALRRQPWRWENGIVLAQLALLTLIAPSAKEAFWSWFWIHGMASFTLLTQGATAAHHHPDIFHDGDEADKSCDFGVGQLEATRDRAGDQHKHMFWIWVSFGEHCLHHLFPTVCHSKLPLLRPVFEQTLEEFALDFPTYFQWELYVGHFRQLARTETRSLAQRHKKKQ